MNNSQVIDYEYIDCKSKSTGRKIRVAKVQNNEFLWYTRKGERPTEKEVYLRKAHFLYQLEAQQELPRRQVHVLHLRHHYPNTWDDVIGLLFTVEAETPDWRPATVDLMGTSRPLHLSLYLATTA